MSITTPSANQTLQYSFSRSRSPSKSEVCIRLWGVSHSLIDNEPVVFLCQLQCPPEKPNPRGRNSAKTRRTLWLIIPSRLNEGSEGSGVGPYFPSCLNGVTTSYRSKNIANSIPFRRWGVLHSRLKNAPGVCLHIRLYLKILFFIHFISYMFYNFIYSLFVLMVYIEYSYLYYFRLL